MTLLANRTTAGFEPIYNKSLGPVPNPVEYLLTPGVAYACGEMVTITDGKLAKVAAGVAINIIGVMAESITAAENVSGVSVYGAVYDHPDNVYRCSFADQYDAAATGGTLTTLVDSTLAPATDDFLNGALIYVYEGPAAGSIRTVADYTGSSHTLTVTTPFPVAPTTASKYILLGLGSEANDVINVGLGGIQLKDTKTIDANAARLTSTVKQGPLVCVDINPADLTMDVMVRRSVHFTG
jgi:hypothetical protein